MKILKFTKKSVNFIKKYLFIDPQFVFLYARAYFKDDDKIDVKTLSEGETVANITAGKSFIRLGDGEMALIKMIDIHFQKAEKALAKDLKEIVLEYKQESKYILAIPTRYINKTNKELKEIGLFRCWLTLKAAYKIFFPKDIPCADAHAFYVSGFFEDNLTDFLKTKKILVITKKSDSESFKKNTADIYKDVKYIEGPSENAFEKLSDIKMKIDSILEQEKREDIVILVAIGPASKVLAYEYSRLGIQVLDIGHGMEYLYTGKALDHVLV
jgi:Glycosyltransferase GT-D fold